MKDIKATNERVYAYAIENANFVDAYFKAYRPIR